MSANRLVKCFLVGLLLLQALVAPPVGAGPGEPGRPEAPGPLPGAAPNAQNVELVGQIGGACRAVAVQGNYAYVGVGPRLVVLDVSDPTKPAIRGQTAVLPAVVRDVALAGGYAYVAVGWAGLRVVDISDPANPREVGAYAPLAVCRRAVNHRVCGRM